MDPVSLAATATAFLIPYLKNVGGKVLEELGKSAWDLITESFKDKPASASTAEEFAANADDPDNQSAFEAQLRKALKENPELAQEIENLLKQAENAGIMNSDGAVATGDGSTALNIDGDVSGNIIVGNGNQISQTTEKPSSRPASKKLKKDK